MPDAPSETMTGSEWLARTIHAAGTTHVFWVDAVLRRTLVELGVLGVTRVLAHSEKAAAYMADGYARVCGRPGLCFAQSVGAANLAAGLEPGDITKYDAVPWQAAILVPTAKPVCSLGVHGDASPAHTHKQA